MSSFVMNTVAEYAKTGRSSCKECLKRIEKGALRLSLVTLDPKWHHMRCFPFEMNSPQDIEGFYCLRESDQEALRKWVVETNMAHTEITDLEEEDRPISFLNSNVKNDYKGATLSPGWKAFETMIFLEQPDGLKYSMNVAAFDFGGCLANTSGHSASRESWSLMHKSIPAKLQRLYFAGYKLVIFVNDSNIDRWKSQRQATVNSRTEMMNDFIRKVNVPMQVFIACGYGKSDRYRKPKTGMWYLMENIFNQGMPVDRNKSFYVGDAKFAQANGLKCFLPEGFFTEPRLQKRKLEA